MEVERTYPLDFRCNKAYLYLCLIDNLWPALQDDIFLLVMAPRTSHDINIFEILDPLSWIPRQVRK